jgi:hypothetical protein
MVTLNICESDTIHAECNKKNRIQYDSYGNRNGNNIVQTILLGNPKQN